MRRPLSALLFSLALTSLSQAATTLVIQPLEEDQASGEAMVLSYTDGITAVEAPLEKGDYALHLDSGDTCRYNLGAEPGSRVRFNRPVPLAACAEDPLGLKVRVAGTIQFTLDRTTPALTLKLLPKKTAAATYSRPLPEVNCTHWNGEAVTVDVSSTFRDGEILRDYYSGNLATVSNGQVTMVPAQGSNGLLLLESADHNPSPFSWDNLTVYFVMTDRFHNGRTDNDQSFGRQPDGKDEIGTFHGGDIRGITEKLDYIQQLGANAIWMTPLVEQVHGFVGGGKNGDFPFYAYHGYWALDYTRLDPNFGTDEELRELVREAHKRGIRLIWDAVINHVGYATGQDLVDFNVEVFKDGQTVDNGWQPGPDQNWHSFHDAIDYNSPRWDQQWWGSDWVRGRFPGYSEPGADDLTMALAGLPDFRTESDEEVSRPPILDHKPGTRATAQKQTVAEHVIGWQTDWVREFGIDGFRSDTVKHVELERWQQLKDSANTALATWKGNNPEQALDDEPFWMVGEVFDHPLFKNYYYDYGFDSLINFEFQQEAHRLAQCMSHIDETYVSYANAINQDSQFNGLTYISSHDTTLFFAKYQNLVLQKRIAAPFLLLPGGVQIYYGDETGRGLGPYGDDFHQGTRSDMNWQAIRSERADLLAHWQKIGQFRNRHIAVGAGKHHKISDAPYTFSRHKGEDRVVVVFAGNES